VTTRVRVPGFTPSVNGLHFVNAFPQEPAIVVDAPPFGRIEIGDASNGLCGGMVFTVCDVFGTPGMTPVPALVPPAAGSPLFRYLVARLIDSWDLPDAGFMKYYEWMVTPDHDTGWPPFFIRRGLAWRTIVEEWAGRIRPELDAGRLCPLGLVTTASPDPADLGHNHQVLAYGYDLTESDDLTLLIYDPNTPQRSADDVRIGLSLASPSAATAISHNVGIGRPIRGFFRVPYERHDPVDFRAPAPLVIRGDVPAGIAAGAPERVLRARRMHARVQPRRIRANAPVRLTVHAVDAETGEPVAGRVEIAGARIGETGVAFLHTFFTTPPHGERRGGRAVGSGTVIAPGYLPAHIDFDVRAG
jgi:hypothetical protein